MKTIKPIDIILVTYQRVYFLKRVIDEIDKRTRYPNRIFVVDNHSTDGTKEYLKSQKKVGKIYEHIFLPENMGLPMAFNEGFKKIGQEKTCSDIFVTTQDDLIPPDLKPCWLERLIHLFNKYYPEYGSICMRIQRTARLEIDENKELIDTRKSMPAVFRIQKRSDLKKTGIRPFGRLKHWESQSFRKIMQQLKMKCAMATHLYANHLGFMAHNKGYVEGFTEYLTYSPQRVDQGQQKPYPEIDEKTNIPVKINHLYDKREQEKREERRRKEMTTMKSIKRKQGQRDLLARYCRGKGIDVGCGARKVCPSAIGIDLFQYPNNEVDMVGIDGADLYMFEDESLDYVIACHSLEHFPDTKKVLKEWDRVLKPKGIMGIIVPDAELRPRTILEESHRVALTKKVVHYLMKHFLGYKPLELRNMAEIEGYNAKTSILAIYRKRRSNKK